jgi:hypothetical protein
MIYNKRCLLNYDTSLHIFDNPSLSDNLIRRPYPDLGIPHKTIKHYTFRQVKIGHSSRLRVSQLQTQDASGTCAM